MRTQPEDDGTIRPVLDALKTDPGTLTMADLVDAQRALTGSAPVDNVLSGIDTDKAGDVPARPDSPEPRPVHQPYSKLTNSAWRMFEEQRASALETARECADAITILEAKRDDALRVADMCLAAQQIGDAR